jgi:hypothetical protein
MTPKPANANRETRVYFSRAAERGHQRHLSAKMAAFDWSSVDNWLVITANELGKSDL